MAILPLGNNERIAWSINFEQHFPALATGLGFTPQEAEALTNDSAAMRHAILYAQVAAAFSKACTGFKNGMLGGVGENQATPGNPGFNPPATRTKHSPSLISARRAKPPSKSDGPSSALIRSNCNTANPAPKYGSPPIRAPAARLFLHRR